MSPSSSRPISHARILCAALLFLCATASGAARATAADDLTAADILRTVRENQAGRHETLAGQLRTNGQTKPFTLVANGPTVRYLFPGPPPTAIQVRYNEDSSQLEESTGGDTERMTPANFDKKVLGTALTYEDLALRFLYWRRAKLLEPDDTTTFPAYKLRLDAPNGQSGYSYVLLWVAKQSGALGYAEGYDADGKLVKRLRVVDVQKINGKMYLKSLNIEDVDPKTGSTRARSYLEIKGVVTPPPPVR